MLRLMNEKEQVSVVADQFGSPTYAADLAEAIMTIINSGVWLPDIYRFSNEGMISWAQLAEAIGQENNSSCTVHCNTRQRPNGLGSP